MLFDSLFDIMGSASLQSPTVSQSRRVVSDTPAKINLILEVLDRRSDGYHNLHSLVIGVGLCDRIACNHPNRSGVTLRSTEPTLETDSNLACRAALMLARSAGIDARVQIDLEKNIPIGAGLGGGSSDAACTLRLCNELWGTGFSDPELMKLGAALGSDVPLFFHLPAVDVSGRGERVAPVSMHWSGYVLIVFPCIHVSTASVFAAWRRDDAASVSHPSFAEILALGFADDLHEHMFNELEPAVYRVAPKVREAQVAVESLGIPATRVTGSGSAFFRLYDDEERAQHDARRIEQQLSGMKVDVVAAPIDVPGMDERDN